MGCAPSVEELNARYENDEDHALNDAKAESEFDDLPSCTEINEKKIDEYFQCDKVLGSGGSCRVLKAKKKSDKTLYAMKELLREDQWNPLLFRKEITILHELRGHANILQYKESYINEKYFYLCTHLCTGGELFDKVKKLKHFSEKQAAEVVTDIIKTIEFVHSKKIVHRDLKPENIVYKTRKSDSDIVIIDFGDAELVKSDQTIYSDFVGTPFYLAPECVRHRCGWELYKSDMWAIGVITYVLLTGRPPFWGRNNREILTKIIKAQIHWPTSVHLSQSCKHFLTCLLEQDPRKRLSATEALRHDWLTTEAQAHDDHLGDETLKSLKKFQSACKLKRLIVMAMVRDMSEADKQMIARAFHELDTNGDGFVDKSELVRYLLATGDLNRHDAEKRAEELIMGMDQDGDGKIDLNEWLQGKTAEQLTTDTNMIEKQFEKILSSSDVNNGAEQSPEVALKGGDGAPPTVRREITTEQIHKSFGDLVGSEELEEIIDEIDQNGDGVLDFQEFKSAMRQSVKV
eukprot:CAMPEP_0197027516 /NCGR_PEP_ID=MMETSP1384-20130603/7406_1 /TAXON_ID=29189 /ORGANISM="Ammonia sp." /LENGTH=516 /DNA_ID=CAMNT_0042456375 /DNA_START=124 /DNA_END=1674 /DNA_ORIENTATION=-